jgi:transposase
VKYEYPQGRRVNALATYDPSAPWLHAQPFERTLTSDDLLAYLRALPAACVPRVVVLDNAGIHTSRVVKAARPGLAKLGIYLYYLPPYSPELNRIEPVFKQVKHHEMSTRSHTSKAELRLSVEKGLTPTTNAYAKKVIKNYGWLLRSRCDRPRGGRHPTTGLCRLAGRKRRSRPRQFHPHASRTLGQAPRGCGLR